MENIQLDTADWILDNSIKFCHTQLHASTKPFHIKARPLGCPVGAGHPSTRSLCGRPLSDRSRGGESAGCECGHGAPRDASACPTSDVGAPPQLRHVQKGGGGSSERNCFVYGASHCQVGRCRNRASWKMRTRKELRSGDVNRRRVVGGPAT